MREDFMDVQRLHPEAILKYWPHIEPALESALSHGAGETPVFEWFKRLVNKPDDNHLWVVFQDGKPVNVTLTKWNYYDTHISLHLVATAGVGEGKWKDYKNAHHTIEQFAKYHNARRIEQYGRKGWTRLLEKLTGKDGERYEQTYVVMSMWLDNDET